MGCGDKAIKFINIKNGKIKTDIFGNYGSVVSLKKYFIRLMEKA